MPISPKNVDEAEKITGFLKSPPLSTHLFHGVGGEIRSRHRAVLHVSRKENGLS